MVPAPRSKTSIWFQRGLTLAGVALVIYLLWAIWDSEILIGWMERARPGRFFLVMAVLATIGIPQTPLILLAGATFGAGVGMIGTVVALALSFVAAYWIGRSRLRTHLVALLERFGYEMPDFHGGTTRAVRFAALTKLTPGLPAFVKKFALGAARVPFGTAFVISMVVSCAYAAVLIFVGQSVFAHELGRTAVVVVCAAFVGFLAWRWAQRRAASAPATA